MNPHFQRQRLLYSSHHPFQSRFYVNIYVICVLFNSCVCAPFNCTSTKKNWVFNRFFKIFLYLKNTFILTLRSNQPNPIQPAHCRVGLDRVRGENLWKSNPTQPKQFWSVQILFILKSIQPNPCATLRTTTILHYIGRI